MTSFGTTQNATPSGFMTTFRIQDQVYHRIGSLLPSTNSDHDFLQIHFMGNATSEAQRGFSLFPDLSQGLV
jgi:hypothetical protein